MNPPLGRVTSHFFSLFLPKRRITFYVKGNYKYTEEKVLTLPQETVEHASSEHLPNKRQGYR